MLQKVVLFWFRRDLRLDDNAGLFHALSSGLPVVPVFIFDSEILRQLEDRDDKRVSFIYTALQHLQAQLVKRGSTLDVRYGKPLEVFTQLISDYSIHAVFTNHDYEPYATGRDKTIEQLLQSNSISFQTFKDTVIFEKEEVVKENGTGYMVYTPYAKRWKARLKEESFSVYETQKLSR